MDIPAFDPKELSLAGEIPGRLGGPPVPIYSFPVTPKEACKALMRRQPVWQITGMEQTLFVPGINPDNIARAIVFDGVKTTMSEGGGRDMFGIEWEYISQAGGSMVRPGRPLLNDANEWRKKLVWPDLDSWDWESAARQNERYLTSDNFIVCWLMNGWFERLVSFMDFEGAIMAMIDEDQKDAVKDLFDKLSDFYIRLFEKYLTHFPGIDGVSIHDDWGSQKETFFSPATAAEMIVPYMRKVTDFLHSRGVFCDFHSCGQLFKQVPNMIAAGWDSWGGQEMNDTHKIYELYGDKLIIGVIPDMFDPETKTVEEQRTAAHEYANKFCNPSKPSEFSFHGAPVLTDVYRQELYIRSRQNYKNNT